MTRQSLWEKDTFRLHNCRWLYKPFDAGEARASRLVAKPTPPPAKLEPQPSQYNNPPSPMDIPVPVYDTRIIETGGKADSLADIPKVVVHCLPAIKTDHTDRTYGQSYKTTKWGKKFAFEAVMLEEQDLGIEFWTTCEEVTVGSIIYPMNKSKRWWKVIDKGPKTGGFLMTAMISDFNPSFAE